MSARPTIPLVMEPIMLSSFDDGETWWLAGDVELLRGMRKLSGMVGHGPTVTVTAVDHEARTITVSGGDR